MKVTKDGDRVPTELLKKIKTLMLERAKTLESLSDEDPTPLRLYRIVSDIESGNVDQVELISTLQSTFFIKNLSFREQRLLGIV